MNDEFFSISPFSLTATRGLSACWAGREVSRKHLIRLTRAMTNRSDSSVDVVWANFGAGKSHALFYLRHLLTAGSNSGVVAIYFEMPKELKRFHDLYCRIVAAIPLNIVVDAIEKSIDTHSPELKAFARACRYGSAEDRLVAEQWILGGRPNLRTLKATTNIRKRIESDLDAVEVLSNVVAALASSGRRVVLLIDEFQRVSQLTPISRRDSILSNLRTLFSSNPTYLSYVIAVMSRVESTALDCLPQELRTLIGVKPSLSLPALSSEEALEFVKKRFACCRPSNYEGDPFAPFSSAAVEVVISRIIEMEHELIPRTILQALGWIYDDRVADGPLSAEAARTSLDQLSWETY